ncbi:hypothetical protein [Pedobacter hartonius]|uniref:Replication initiation factor n=1 Tax=Pedobacter hartonius TaxID=425514 RepID=A0A1H4F514_9SPHI|nr:hypothetical protein [Pedobacter hartonius]SEA92445.1 hypothetical protein SAMN05443550_10717 [Pedobacter hartonius]
MIDYASFKISNFSNSEFEKLTELINVECPLSSNKVNFDFENLRIFYYPDTRVLFIKNSLHKFYNKSIGRLQLAENYNDFHLTDMLAVADIFSELYFNRPIEDFELSTNLEVGVNIEIARYKPFDIMDRYLSYQVGNNSSSFITCEPRGDKGKPIMRKCYLSDYNLKFYDKSKQAKINFSNILRYEVIFCQLRKIRAVLGEDHLTMQTLCEFETWKKFGDYILRVYNGIRKLPIVEKHIPQREIYQIHGHCSKHLKEDLQRELTKSEYNNIRIANAETYDYWNTNANNVHVQIENQLKNKINHLVTGSVS